MTKTEEPTGSQAGETGFPLQPIIATTLSGGSGLAADENRKGGYLVAAIDWMLYIGLVLTTLLVPFLFSSLSTDPFIGPKEFTAKIAIGFLGIILCARFFFVGEMRSASSSVAFPLTLFLVFASLSLLWNFNVSSAFRDLRGTLTVMLLYPLIVNTVCTRRKLEGLLWAIVLAGAAVSVLGILESHNAFFRFDPAHGMVFARDEIFRGQIDFQAFYVPLFPVLANPGRDLDSIVATLGNRNYLATFVMFTAFIPAALSFYYRSYVIRLFSLALFSVMIWALFITSCRAAFIGLLAGFVFMAWKILRYSLHGPSFRQKAKLLALIGVLTALLFLLVMSTSGSLSLLDKFKTTWTMDKATSNLYERIWIWSATYDSFSNSVFRWVFGNGFGSFRHFYPIQQAKFFQEGDKDTFPPGTFRQAHNDWLQLISELGLVGLVLLLFLLWQTFGMAHRSIQRDVEGNNVQDGLTGDHVLLVGLCAGLLSQMVAALADFPFHRIESVLHVIVVLALLSVLAETGFFTKHLPTRVLVASPAKVTMVALAGIVLGLATTYSEIISWQADSLVCAAEARMADSRPDALAEARKNLSLAIELDPLPGEPYLKMATILEREGKGIEALAMADQASQNINYNGRSTYHSVVFRQMRICYHLLRDPRKTLEFALSGHHLTSGPARALYYQYIARAAMELGEFDKAEWALLQLMKFPAFERRASAEMATCLAKSRKWAEARRVAASVSRQLNDGDPEVLHALGLAAWNLGQFTEAIVALQKAIKLNPARQTYRLDLFMVMTQSARLLTIRSLVRPEFLFHPVSQQAQEELSGLLASASWIPLEPGMNFPEPVEEERSTNPAR